MRTRVSVPHQPRFIQHAIYTHGFPPQEVPHAYCQDGTAGTNGLKSSEPASPLGVPDPHA